MATPPLGDRSLDLLVRIYSDAAQEIIDMLGDLSIAEATRKAAIYNQIVHILQKLREAAVEFGQVEIVRFFEEADKAAIEALKTVTKVDRAWTRANEEAVESLARAITQDISGALESVKVLAAKVMRGTSLPGNLDAEARTAVARGMAQGEATRQIAPKVASAIRTYAKDGMISIVGKDGRSRRYNLDYYSALVAHQARRQATTLATITRALQNDYDLVRISPNPSTIGDYCDLFRGRVFSISGTHDYFPPLADTPNGGPPFHPWCKHTASIFVPGMYSEEELAEFGDVDEEFLGFDRDNINELEKLWRKRKAEDPTLGDLNFI